MNLLFRIWGAALILQPLFFAFGSLWAAAVIIPFEIGGSLPAIAVFGLMMKGLYHLPIPASLKSFLLYVSGAVLATLASLAVLLLVVPDAEPVFETYIVLLPAPLAALGALLLHHKAVMRFFEELNEPQLAEDIPEPE